MTVVDATGPVRPVRAMLARAFHLATTFGAVGVSSYVERRKKRYAEDAEYRERTRAYNHAWYVANKERVNADRRRKWAENPDRNKKQRAYYARSQRKTMLKCTYGISVEEYEALLAKQNGVCAICEEKPPGQTLCVDHCHVTGKIRGLLCRSCNVGLGNFRDDPRLMRAGIAYLEASLADDQRPVIAGLDPAIHPFREESSCEEDGCPGQARA